MSTPRFACCYISPFAVGRKAAGSENANVGDEAGPPQKGHNNPHTHTGENICVEHSILRDGGGGTTSRPGQTSQSAGLWAATALGSNRGPVFTHKHTGKRKDRSVAHTVLLEKERSQHRLLCRQVSRARRSVKSRS